MNQEYAEATQEAYLPQECEFYGFNETGGLEYVNPEGRGPGEWRDHCFSYKDKKDIA